MKIKRKEYERLAEVAARFADLERIWIVQRVRLDDGTEPEVLRMPLTTYALINAIDSDIPFSGYQDWILAPSQLEFIRIYTGYDQFLARKYESPWNVLRKVTLYGSEEDLSRRIDAPEGSDGKEEPGTRDA
jgi:hypothetical protein